MFEWVYGFSGQTVRSDDYMRSSTLDRWVFLRGGNMKIVLAFDGQVLTWYDQVEIQSARVTDFSRSFAGHPPIVLRIISKVAPDKKVL